MTCAQARILLVRDAGQPAGELAQHTAGCAACALFASRRELARAALCAHHLDVEPDADFSARVRSRIEETDDALGWAALRLLPAALALLLVLAVVHRAGNGDAGGALAVSSAESPGAGAVQPADAVASEASGADDVLLWIADGAGGDS